MSAKGRAPRFGLLVGLASVAGLLVAGLLLPAVGSAGLVARSMADDWESLPAELKETPLAQQSRILAADGTTLATFYYENRVNVRLAQVPKVMQKAIIAIEDVRFYEHHGIDVKGSARALLENSRTGSVQQGGSTLTQQYVKNLLIESAETEEGQAAAREQTVSRKLREAKYALSLEKRLSKADILEGYLNIAYFGSGAYGVGTAAKHYFGVPVDRLTLPQAALLAGVVQNPSAYDPIVRPKAAQARRDTVLRAMAKWRMITDAEAAKAIATPIRLKVTRVGNGCEGTSAPYFCDYVLEDFLRDPAYGATKEDRNKLLLRGGLTIRTTLDRKVQKAADDAVQKHVPGKDPSGVAAAEAVVEPGTGHIKAIAVSAPFGYDKKAGQNSVNYAADFDHGGSTGFPAGSTFKVFVLAAALKEGMPLSTAMNAPSRLHNVTGFRDCSGREHVYPEVSNADPGEAGKFNLQTGTWHSVNTFFVLLERRTGLCEPIRIAEAMGVSPASPRTSSYPRIPQYPSFVLGGASEFSPLDVASAYATLAAHGTHCTPVAITRVTDRSGRSYAVTPPECNQALEPGLADTVTSVLTGVFKDGTGRGLGLAGRPAAGKTGTVDDYGAAWFAGYTPQLASAVWVGHPTDRIRHPLRNIVIGGRSYGHVYGATIPGPIWQDTMNAAHEGLPVVQFAKPDPAFARGRTVAVPAVAGLSVDEAKAVLTEAGFEVAVSRVAVPSTLPRGVVDRTDPPAGSQATPGTVVTILVSSGTPPSASPAPSATTSPPPPPPSPTVTPPGATASATPTQSPHGPPTDHP